VSLLRRPRYKPSRDLEVCSRRFITGFRSPVRKLWTSRWSGLLWNELRRFTLESSPPIN